MFTRTFVLFIFFVKSSRAHGAILLSVSLSLNLLKMSLVGLVEGHMGWTWIKGKAKFLGRSAGREGKRADAAAAAAAAAFKDGSSSTNN